MLLPQGVLPIPTEESLGNYRPQHVNKDLRDGSIFQGSGSQNVGHKPISGRSWPVPATAPQGILEPHPATATDKMG